MKDNWLRERCIFADGESMSIQASHFHYCTPRQDGEAHYSKVEIGYPSCKEDTLMDYAERPEDPTGTVYGWVPADIVAAIVAKHGGVVSGKMPPLAVVVTGMKAK